MRRIQGYPESNTWLGGLEVEVVLQTYGVASRYPAEIYPLPPPNTHRNVGMSSCEVAHPGTAFELDQTQEAQTCLLSWWGGVAVELFPNGGLSKSSTLMSGRTPAPASMMPCNQTAQMQGQAFVVQACRCQFQQRLVSCQMCQT